MIDIHSHILPEIDDGASDLKESLTMAKMAVADGIKTMIATPHITEKTPNRIFLQDKVVVFKRALTAANIPLNIALGGEIPFHFNGDIADFTLCNSSYILLELPHNHVPDTACQKVYELQVQGYKVIIAHPERNSDILKDPTLLEEIIDCGALAQVTAESVTGELGAQIQHCAHHLLRRKMIHFIGSDCHSCLQRKPLLHKAKTIAGKIIGKEEAIKLVEQNPSQIINAN